jgi:hypothetical protein
VGSAAEWTNANLVAVTLKVTGGWAYCRLGFANWSACIPEAAHWALDPQGSAAAAFS